MKGRHLILFTSFVSLLSFLGCKNARVDHASVISQWIGREVVLPDALLFQIQGDTIDLDFGRPDFMIVNYVDSTGCTSCRMKLDLWTDVINEFKALTDFDIEVVTIVNPAGIDDVSANLRRNNYLSPVAFDTCNTFDQTNSLPPRSEHHCFLLDAENRVVAIGNPVLNPKIRELYKQYITADIEPDYDNVVNSRPAKPLGVVHSGEAVSKSFYISAGDSADYTVQALIPSCDCVDATVRSVSEAGVLKVDVTYTADSVPGAFSRYVDVFFNEKDAAERLVVYGYVKKP